MIRCVILDPEPVSANWLERMCKQLPFLTVCGKFDSAFDAYVYLQHEKVDLLFIDTQIQDMSIPEFFRIITHKPFVIFTSLTGYMALEAFAYDALDYLVKPIEMQRFIRSVNKASEQIRIRAALHSENGMVSFVPESRTKTSLFVNSEYKMIRLEIPKIQLVEGLKDYLKIYLDSPKPILTMMRMKAIEEKLPSPDFVRIHRSFIINLNHVEAVQKNKVLLSNREIPIGEMYSDQFFKALESF